MPTIKEIKAELKKNKIKGITGKKKAELLKMLGASLSDLENPPSLAASLRSSRQGLLGRTRTVGSGMEEDLIQQLKDLNATLASVKKDLSKLNVMQPSAQPLRAMRDELEEKRREVSEKIMALRKKATSEKGMTELTQSKKTQARLAQEKKEKREAMKAELDRSRVAAEDAPFDRAKERALDKEMNRIERLIRFSNFKYEPEPIDKKMVGKLSDMRLKDIRKQVNWRGDPSLRPTRIPEDLKDLIDEYLFTKEGLEKDKKKKDDKKKK